MDESGRFKRALLSMLQSGAYREILGYQDGQCGIVEFILQKIYRVRLAPHRLVLEEREVELIRRRFGRRWRRYPPITIERGCVVIGRRSGEVLRSPSLGRRARNDSCVWSGGSRRWN